MLKIHYQINSETEQSADSFNEASANSGGSGGAKKDKGKVGGGMFGGGLLSGLKVGRKEIVTKDWKVMRRVYTAIQNYSRRSTLM